MWKIPHSQNNLDLCNTKFIVIIYRELGIFFLYQVLGIYNECKNTYLAISLKSGRFSQINWNRNLIIVPKRFLSQKNED